MAAGGGWHTETISMPFSDDTKARMFIKSARLCCLCFKQCGTNIEAAHIIDEHAGGPNDEDNGIPVCLDCHQEMGAYNDKHPKGNKLRPKELKGRRNHVYRLVETGVIHARLVAIQARAKSKGGVPALPDEVKPPEPSLEGRRMLESLLKVGHAVNAPGGKLRLLSPDDRAYVLDKLVESAPEMPVAVEILMRAATSKLAAEEDAKVMMERTARHVTLYGSPRAKAALLREIPKSVLAESSEEVRQALFEEIIEIIKQDQFSEVNEVVPALVDHCAAVPPELYKDFVFALIEHSRSSARRGAPAAREALKALPDDMARAAIKALDPKYLTTSGHSDELKQFVERYKQFIKPASKEMLQDFVKLTYRRFTEKYLPEEADDD